MRRYCATDIDGLVKLAAGEQVVLAGVVAASEDEDDEFDALWDAADLDVVVVTVEVPDETTPIALDLVAALHFDADDSGDLSWYDPSEIHDVIALLTP